MAHHSRKEDNELVQAIMGGEMRNAWQPTAPGEGKDMRSGSLRGIVSRPSSPEFERNYLRIFRKEA